MNKEIIKFLKNDIDDTEKQLTIRIRALVDSLNNELGRVAAGIPPNRLGLIQGEAQNVDRLCAILNEKLDFFKLIKSEKWNGN